MTLKTHERRVEIEFRSPLMYREYPDSKRMSFMGWRTGRIEFSTTSPQSKSIGRLLEELPIGTEISEFKITDMDSQESAQEAEK